MTAKSVDISFFSSADNTLPAEKKAKEAKAKKEVLTGYISVSGKLVVPAKTAANLAIDLTSTLFKVGIQEGKRKAKSLYLVSVEGEQTDAFQFEKAAKSYTMLIPYILKKSGIDFAKNKYAFTVRPFDYEGVSAFELQLSIDSSAAKAGENEDKKNK